MQFQRQKTQTLYRNFELQFFLFQHSNGIKLDRFISNNRSICSQKKKTTTKCSRLALLRHDFQPFFCNSAFLHCSSPRFRPCFFSSRCFIAKYKPVLYTSYITRVATYMQNERRDSCGMAERYRGIHITACWIETDGKLTSSELKFKLYE